jgi:hypothetical protein
MRVFRPGSDFDILDVKRSVFLAGPTPRDEFGCGWREEAICLISLPTYDFPNFTAVFSPELENGQWLGDYDGQVEWERRGLDSASIILFWVPRELQHMPAFTTNVEFGMYMNSGRVVLGYPSNAPKMKYLDWHARRLGIPVRNTLPETIEACQHLLAMKLRP